MQALQAYICTVYAVVLLACVAGVFNRHYDANLAQRVALSLFAVWLAWRMGLVWRHGWGYPHEPLVASAMALYALGSAYKTIVFRLRAKKGGRRHGDV